jgi:DNA-binding MarR family transcriptional regulator
MAPHDDRSVETERRRDSILEALELFRSIHPDIWVSAIVAFLYICENEGINVRELAYVTGMTDATASRTIRALAGTSFDRALPPRLDLVAIHENPVDGRGRLIYLSDRGRQLQARLDGIIRAAVETTGRQRDG